jgi:hypothetical protein
MNGSSLAQLSRIMNLYLSGREHPRFTAGNATLKEHNVITLPIVVTPESLQTAGKNRLPIDEITLIYNSLMERRDRPRIYVFVEAFQELLDQFSTTDLGRALKLMVDIQNTNNLLLAPLFFKRLPEYTGESAAHGKRNMAVFFIGLYLAWLNNDFTNYTNLEIRRDAYIRLTELHSDEPDFGFDTKSKLPVARVLFQEFVPKDGDYRLTMYALKPGASIAEKDLEDVDSFDGLPPEMKELLVLVGTLKIEEGDIIAFSHISLGNTNRLFHEVTSNKPLSHKDGHRGIQTTSIQ